ncbi:unnamed protein product [Rotaria sp. Silwood2]|nr:unnamed protein product [Rotaria sp. Silwood2]
MHPKANLQRENDATSEDSSSMSTNKPSKSPPRRTQRPSDQWSDDTGISASETKPVSHGLTNLIKNNPLKPHTIQTNIKNNENSTLNSLAENNPLQMNSKRPAPTAQRTQSSSIFGIQPAFNRKDSDNTSTSISNEKLPKQVQPILEKKSNIYVNTLPQQPSHTKSWSDDTITVPAAQIKKSEQHSETWDTSTSDDDNIVTSKPQHVSNILQKTLPFSPSKDDAIESDSDNNSVDTEIQKFDINKPSNETTIQKLVNNKIGNGYRVIGLTEIHSPVSEDSSWTITSAKINKESIKNTKGITNLIQQMKTDESTWDDSHQLSHSLKQSKGIENLVKIMDTIVQTKPSKQPTSSNIIGKLITTSMFERADSRASENTLHEVDNDEDYEQSWKKKSEELPVTSMKDHNSKKIQHSSLPYDINNLQHGSISSTKSSFSEIQINELKENIKKLEPNQEDTQELKRQLKDMENKKNNFEKLYKENNQMLRQIENKLEQEKNEKQRLEWTTKNLNIDLQNIKQKLQLLEDEKDLLNQRCNKLKEERDNHDEKLRMLHTNNLQTSNKNSYHDDDIDKIQSRHREELKLLSAENDDLHYRTKQLESDLELHKESLDVTVRYKIDLEKALEEKTFYQHELDRLKHEKDLIEQEKLEYKTKYDSLQDEIRLILLDRSKLEQKLTSELQEHMQEKQRSTDDKQKYRIEIEQLNIKLNDAEARLRGLQTHNEALLVSKDRDIKNEFESLSHRLNQIESNKLNAEQRYHNQHNEITNKQQQQVLNEPSITHASTTISNNHTHDQHSHSSSCKNCNAVQRSYEQEREYRLQTEKDNERLRHSFSHQKQYQYFNKTFPLQQQNNENYLIENSRKIRSDTERVKSELNRLREDFDKLVSNYEPINNFQQQVHLRSQIDTFRQFYENEFQQRQLLMSKLTPELKSSLTQNYHQLSSPHLNHNHSFNETCTTCTNSRLLRERLDTAIDTSLADQRLQKIKQIPSIPRQASSLLTINTLNHGMLSSIELLRERYYV